MHPGAAISIRANIKKARFGVPSGASFGITFCFVSFRAGTRNPEPRALDAAFPAFARTSLVRHDKNKRGVAN